MRRKEITMIIINTRADLDTLSTADQAVFKARLAAGIYNWQWIDGQWELVAETAILEPFGFTAADFPDAPKPEKPDYNPDEREAQRKADEAIESRRNAYIAEADPLFFKAQRGEATLQEWQDKVAEIKARFPKPE
jgi:hypothetical protein